MSKTKPFLLAKLTVFFVGGLFIYYIGNQVYRIFSMPVKTELAFFVDNVYESILVDDSLMVRDEALIKSSDQEGVMAYLLEDGDRVAKDAAVAAFYKNEDDIIKKLKISKIESQIKTLRQLNSLQLIQDTSPNAADKQITHQLKSVLSSLNEQDYKCFKDSKEKFLYLISERQFMTHQLSNFSDKIKELEMKKDSIDISSAREQSYVKSSCAGYFSSRVDGYETSFNYNLIKDITLDNFNSIKRQENANEKNIVGKIVSDQNWYVIAKVKKDDSIKFKLNDELDILIPNISYKQIPVKVEAINQKNRNDDALVILKGDYLNENLILARKESMKIIFNVHSGIRVNKSALHEKTVTKSVETENGKVEEVTKNIKGVYVVYAGELVFKEIIPLYTDSNYVICDSNPSEEKLFSSGTIKAYDRVVVDGKNLYEGKIVK